MSDDEPRAESLHAYLRQYARTHRHEHVHHSSLLRAWPGSRARYSPAHVAQCTLPEHACTWAHSVAALAPAPRFYQPYGTTSANVPALVARAYGGFVSEMAYAGAGETSVWTHRGPLSVAFRDLYPTLLSEALRHRFATSPSPSKAPVFDVDLVVCDQFALYGKCGEQARCRYLHVRRRVLRRAFGRIECACTLAKQNLFCPGAHAGAGIGVNANGAKRPRGPPPGLAAAPLENWTWCTDAPLSASTLRLIEC